MAGWSVRENHWYYEISPTQVHRKWNVVLEVIARGFIRREDHLIIDR